MPALPPSTLSSPHCPPASARPSGPTAATPLRLASTWSGLEAGAQGEDKLGRGYVPKTSRSAQYMADPGLRQAIDDYLKRERAYVEAAGRELREASPFRKCSGAEDREAQELADEDAGF